MSGALSKPTESPLSKAVRQGLEAARLNLKPAIGLWVCGLAFIVCYFCLPAFRQSLESLRLFKVQSGLAFSFVSTAIFGGLIPVLIPNLLSKRVAKYSMAYLLVNVFVWGLKGIEVDLFYQFQCWLFGDDPGWATVASKVAFDQFIYVPIFGGINMLLFYFWRDAGYRFSKLKDDLGEQWYWNKILPILISNWFVWIPACTLVYMLPLGLQLPIQNLILCFWVLVMTFMTEDKS